METNEVTNLLHDLAQIDYDAVQAYERAINDVDDDPIRMHFEAFRKDHERHVQNLGDLAVQKGGERPDLSRDVQGLFLEGYTALRGAMGTHGAVEAVEKGERHVNNKYEDALEEDLPPDVRRQVEANYADEQRHLQYVQQLLRSGV